jgi:uncharacterized protein YbjT (DUF2867 family)
MAEVSGQAVDSTAVTMGHLVVAPPFIRRRRPGPPSFGRITKTTSMAIQGRGKDFPSPCTHSSFTSIAVVRSKSNGEQVMKIVVIGGSGLIGSNVVKRLRQKGHDVLAASPDSGVNTVTGEGVAEAVAGAQVVVDVANSPSLEDKAVMAFFTTAGRNLLAAEAAAGVGHHLALSIVGTDRNPESGYLRAKLAQEDLIKAAGIPYTILRSTQFFEFINGIIKGATEGDVIRLSPALFQPIAAEEAAAALADLAIGPALNATVEIAGPEARPLDKFARTYLSANGDKRQVAADVHARYFGTELNDRSLTPGDHPRLGSIRFEDWLSRAAAQR